MEDFWTPEQDQIIIELRKRGLSWEEIGRAVGRSGEGARKRTARINPPHPRLEESPYPIHNNSLNMEGDALILPDLEAPFHNADFTNRCLDLAGAWGITQAILAGDAVHLDSLSTWGADWQEPTRGMDEESRKAIEEFIDGLPGNKRSEGYELLATLEQSVESNISGELGEARKVFRVLDECFEKIDYVLGNHCSRWLRTFDQNLLPRELLINLTVDNPKWRVSSFYYSYLLSNKEKYRIEHPVGSGKETAVNLADTYECHVIMGHSHRLKFEFSTSGRYYAIQAGACVDENRLAYVMQRSKGGRNPHTLGAVIVRGGYPHLLHPYTDFKNMEKMA